jgi:hypothetical protein
MDRHRAGLLTAVLMSPGGAAAAHAQTPKGGEHPATAQSIGNPDLEMNWNTKMSGLHQIRPIVKLVDGTWLVGDLAQDTTRVVTAGTVLDKTDLTKVDEIGFADLMPGSGHGPGGWSDVAQIEVYARPVARTAATSQ